MKGEGLYFSGKRDRAPVSEPFRRGNILKIFVSYMSVDCSDLPGERDVASSVGSEPEESLKRVPEVSENNPKALRK